MATTTYISMTAPISAVVTTCPTLVIADAIRQTVIDLCERGQVWKYTHPDMSLITPTYEYSFIPPNSDIVISMIETARVDDQPIELQTSQGGIQNFPTFPDTTDLDTPNTLWQMNERSFFVAPTPDTTYTLKLTVTLKPTVTSTGADTTMIQEHLETINHGTLHRLLLQQKRDWFNADLAGYHGKQYSYKVNMFRAVANKGFGQNNISVAMRPFA